MHNYIRYKMALNRNNIYTTHHFNPTGPDTFIHTYYPSKNEENFSVVEYTPENLSEFLNRWNTLSNLHKNLSIFRNSQVGANRYDNYNKGIHVNSKQEDPYFTLGTSAYYSPDFRNVGYGIGHYLAHEMIRHPHGSYILEDALHEIPEHEIEDFKKKHVNPLSVSYYPEFDPTDRNKFLLQVLPHYWNNLLNKVGDTPILQYMQESSPESLIEGLLREDIQRYAKKGYKLALDPQRIVRNTPVTLIYDPNVNENLPYVNTEPFNDLNRLLHIHQGVPNLFNNPRKLLYGHSDLNIPFNELTPNIHNFHTEAFDRFLGYLVGQHLGLHEDKLPTLKDFIEDSLRGDTDAKSAVSKFHKKYNLPEINYHNPKELLTIAYPIYHANKLKNMNIDLGIPYSWQDLHNHLTTPDENETDLEAILRNDYAQLHPL